MHGRASRSPHTPTCPRTSDILIFDQAWSHCSHYRFQVERTAYDAGGAHDPPGVLGEGCEMRMRRCQRPCPDLDVSTVRPGGGGRTARLQSPAPSLLWASTRPFTQYSAPSMISIVTASSRRAKYLAQRIIVGAVESSAQSDIPVPRPGCGLQHEFVSLWLGSIREHLRHQSPRRKRRGERWVAAGDERLQFALLPRVAEVSGCAQRQAPRPTPSEAAQRLHHAAPRRPLGAVVQSPRRGPSHHRCPPCSGLPPPGNGVRHPALQKPGAPIGCIRHCGDPVREESGNRIFGVGLVRIEHHHHRH